MASWFMMTRMKLVSYTIRDNVIRFSVIDDSYQKDNADRSKYDCSIFADSNKVTYEVAKKLLRKGDHYNIRGRFSSKVEKINNPEGEEERRTTIHFKVDTIELDQEYASKPQSKPKEQFLTGFGEEE